MFKNLHFKLFFSFSTLILFISFHSVASNNTRQIVITGKVSNSVYGNPVSNHPVHIISESVSTKNASYFKTVYTDEEGFYYDTLTTFLNKGTLQIYTFDYNNKIQEQTCYFRFIELAARNVFVADFNIYMPFQAEQLQARFKYSQRQNDNRFRYRFTDQTNYENINEWQWNFGDGEISAEKNPEHTFATTGLFKVQLTVTTMIFGMKQSSTTSSLLYISDQAYYHLGGHCFAEYFPIDKGKAILYYINELDKFIPIDTVSFDTLGYYYFYEIPEGEYCIKVQPGASSEYYGKMIPTYFGDEIFWEAATHISHHQTNWEYDIHLAEGKKTGYGSCSISGNVAYGDTLTNSLITPAEGIDIYLLDSEETVLTSRYSDNSGNFGFDEIGEGNYWLTADIPGYGRKNKLVVLNNENPNFNSIQIVVEHGDINMSSGENTSLTNNSSGNLYPNPANHATTYEISSETKGMWTIEIHDSRGQVIQTAQVFLEAGINRVKLDISVLKAGYYFVVLKNNSSIYGKPLVKIE